MYQEVKPSEHLNSMIDCYWIFSDNEVCEKFKVLPDTCADLIFDLNQDHGFISGVMSRFQHLELAAESDLIGIRFRTENFGSLSKIPLSETKNLRVELSEIFSPNKLISLEELKDLETVSDKIIFLENYIATSFKENCERQDKMIISVAKNIRSHQGNINIKDLARSNHLSQRQVERRFKSYIGLTIKEFSNIVRFNYAKKTIASLTETSLLEIAFDMGFYDHSHMNYEFKRVSGENPSYFR